MRQGYNRPALSERVVISCQEHEWFQLIGSQRSIEAGVCGCSSNGDNGEPPHVPHQLGWARAVNRGGGAGGVAVRWWACFCRRLSCVWSFALARCLFPELTRRRADTAFDLPKCSLLSFLGRGGPTAPICCAAPHCPQDCRTNTGFHQWTSMASLALRPVRGMHNPGCSP